MNPSAELKAALESDDSSQIEAKTQTLAQASMKLGEAMYKSQAGQAGEASGEPSEPGVVDAEFEEVSDDKKSA